MSELQIKIPRDEQLYQKIAALEAKIDMLLNMQRTEEFLDAAQVASLLGFAERTIAEKISKRPGFPQKYGRRWKKAEVVKWAAGNL